jgi:hypothetical protein
MSRLMQAELAPSGAARSMNCWAIAYVETVERCAAGVEPSVALHQDGSMGAIEWVQDAHSGRHHV